MGADHGPTTGEREQLGRYAIAGTLGVGGMATVYLGRLVGEGGFQREVAIKVLHPHYAADRGFVEAFFREARLAACTRHPLVVPVLDVGRDARGRPYLVMDYVPGASLADLRRLAAEAGRTLPRDVAIRCLADALAGLEAAHDTVEDGRPVGLVHRDFSPHNLLVGTDGYTRLGDFGLAKGSEGPKLTETDVVKGKVPYMSPEQAEGRALDRRSDVWAAGVVAWELLAGRRLHRDGDPVAILLRVVRERPPRVTEAWPDCPAPLADAVAWALEHDLGARCPTAQAFRDRLVDAFEAGVGLLASRAVVAETVRALAPSTAHEPTTESGDLTPSEASPRAGAPASATIRLPTRRRGAIAGIALTAAAAIGGIAWARSARGPVPGVSPDTPARAESAAARAAPPPPVESPAAPPAGSLGAAEVVAPAARTVQVEADAPMAELRIGDTQARLDAPEPTFAMTLPPDAVGRRLEASAVASDGRTTTAVVEADAETLELSFPARRRARSAPRRVRDAPGATPPLASSPYGDAR